MHRAQKIVIVPEVIAPWLRNSSVIITTMTPETAVFGGFQVNLEVTSGFSSRPIRKLNTVATNSETNS